MGLSTAVLFLFRQNFLPMTSVLAPAHLCFHLPNAITPEQSFARPAYRAWTAGIRPDFSDMEIITYNILSCCGPLGICGYGPSYCGTGCTSNCDAKANCGKYSVTGLRKCGMNLCCSMYGWCGVSETFTNTKLG